MTEKAKEHRQGRRRCHQAHDEEGGRRHRARRQEGLDHRAPRRSPRRPAMPRRPQATRRPTACAAPATRSARRCPARPSTKLPRSPEPGEQALAGKTRFGGFFCVYSTHEDNATDLRRRARRHRPGSDRLGPHRVLVLGSFPGGRSLAAAAVLCAPAKPVLDHPVSALARPTRCRWASDSYSTQRLAARARPRHLGRVCQLPSARAASTARSRPRSRTTSRAWLRRLRCAPSRTTAASAARTMAHTRSARRAGRTPAVDQPGQRELVLRAQARRVARGVRAARAGLMAAKTRSA